MTCFFNAHLEVALVPSSKDFLIGFWIIAENKFCGEHKFMFPLFSMIICTDEQHFCDF